MTISMVYLGPPKKKARKKSLDYKAYNHLVSLLRESYILTDLKDQSVKVRTASENSYHREMHAHLISGTKELNGIILLKSLQHPAKIFTQDYAMRVAKALRMA